MVKLYNGECREKASLEISPLCNNLSVILHKSDHPIVRVHGERGPAHIISLYIQPWFLLNMVNPKLCAHMDDQLEKRMHCVCPFRDALDENKCLGVIELYFLFHMRAIFSSSPSEQENMHQTNLILMV